VRYRAFDLLDAGPQRIQEMLLELLELFEQGALQHLPIATWDVRQGQRAFRHVSQTRHVGKVVLTVPQPLDPDATVLITGGTGGLGALLARHLVERHGARHLLLVSRSGEQAPGARQLAHDLRDLGCDVRIESCDVCDREQVAGLLGGIADAHPLGVVVHAAGVLDDGALESMTPERVLEVVKPKLDGAMHLHELTRDLDLAAFVLFSSAAGTFGSPGQSSYAAANACLDALAHHRRANGLATTSMAWGLWAQESGMTDHLDGADRMRLGRVGQALSTERALELFDRAGELGEPVVLPLELDPRALQALARVGLLPSLLRSFVRAPARRAREAAGSLAHRLAAAPQGERKSIALEVVRGHVAAVLGHASPRAIDPARTFKDLGFDSLSAIELRNRLVAATGLRLPSTLVFDYPTPAAVAGHVSAQLAGTEPAAAKAVLHHKGLDEPIALVGMSCRYPGGVGSPQDLWNLLAHGRDAVGAFPADRGWDLDRLRDRGGDRQWAAFAREGGFVHDAGEFDAAFFSISPREAAAMDPQQRLLLEAAWEALEDGAFDPTSLAGSDTGVFAGVSSADYGTGIEAHELAEGYRLTGQLTSVISGRVAYTFGFEGPAVTVDTACSSSLVALHLAAQALRSGECSLALAGGVTVIATPGGFAEFSRQGGLAPDGRCKSFADGADGAGFSEGVGVVLLERLSDARRSGHRVLAVIRGSAVNQDGASNGLTAPNGPSQQRVIAQALANAELVAGDVDAVEGHGTGTVLGDPIEAQALLATYGRDRPADRPLWLGSVKSNIGHTQAAAGVAGVIKMVMAMRHGLLPRTLHVDAPSGHVDWSAGAVSLLTEQTPWQANGRPRRAGVSAFGISGTNAHVILEEPLAPAPVTPESAPVPLGSASVTPGSTDDSIGVLGGEIVPWVLSGRGGEGLRGQAGRLAEFVGEHPELAVSDVGFSLVRRAAFEHRAVVLGGGREQLLGRLGKAVLGEPAPGVIQGAVGSGSSAVGSPGVVFVFSGQGGQWPGMAVELLDASPVFAEELRSCGEALAPHVDWSLEEVLRGVDDAPGLDEVDVVQPALWAVMVALAGLWRTCGVRPGVVVGHSQGEIAAVCVAGGLSLEDAARLVVARSRALVSLMGRGGMVSVALSESEVGGWLERWQGAVSVAAVNGPGSVVVSGRRGALDGLLGELEAGGVRAREIPVGYASHSVQIEEIREELLEGCSGMEPRAGDVPFFSTVTGGLIDTAMLDGAYWYRNLRDTVRFEHATRSLLEQGHQAFIEVGPHPVLAMAIQETVETVDAVEGVPGEGVLVTGSLRRDDGGPGRFLTSLGEAWVHGIDVDWARLYRGSGTRQVALPTYAFQRRRYWLAPSAPAGEMAGAGQASVDHPLLSATVELAGDGGWLFTGRLSQQTHPWLADHAVTGVVLLPGTAFVELALRAGAQVGCKRVEELTLEAPLVLPGEGAVQLQVSVGGLQESGRRSMDIYSRAQDTAGDDGVESAETWTRHACGMLATDEAAAEDLTGAQEMTEVCGDGVWPPAGAEIVDVDDLYEQLAARGYDYGPSFQGLRTTWRRGDELFAEVALPEAEQAHAGCFAIHPALLDASLHALAAGVSDEATGTDQDAGAGRPLSLRLPFSWGGVAQHAIGGARVRVRLSPAASGDSLSLAVADERGAPVLSVAALTLREISPEQLAGARDGYRESLFGVDWTALTRAPVQETSTTELALLGSEGIGLSAELRAAGIAVASHADLTSLGQAVEAGGALPGTVLVDFALPTHIAAATHTDAPVRDVIASTNPDGSAYDIPAAAHANAHRVLGLVQEWLADARFSASRLVVVTRGGVAASDDERSLDLGRAPVWGLVRSAQTEHPGRFVLADLDDEAGSIRALSAALATEESQFVIREGVISVPRLARVGSAGELVPPIGQKAWRLDAARAGTLESLSLVACPEAAGPLQAGQVRIAVRAAGLNFRDVLIALNMYPGEAILGSEAAGVVIEVGPGVRDLTAGDRVMGMMAGGFAPIAVADRRLLARIPDGWSFAEAASVPVAFLTAYYALVDLARLRPGEKLLVHAAAGGVGMAAVQIARHLGAEVFGTASQAKWDALGSLGLDEAHIASSRTLAFKDLILQATGGQGVDVVLDSLAREFVDASLELLPRGGRFVEMGKTDVRDPRHVAGSHEGVTYRAFDLQEAGPERIQEMLLELLELFAGGALRLAPITTRKLSRAQDAFRFMSQARHTGKIVLELPAPLDRGTTLITGGVGVLGSSVARHLVAEQGVRSVLLASRRGRESAGAIELETELKQMGARVTVAACDVSDRGELEALLGSVPAEYPLCAVVHAAGVLDDGVVDALTPERVDRVLAPKIDAAWHLHELTEGLDLSAFMLFSSMSATLGGAGQANYAAANAFLDTLAAYRRAKGLEGVSVAWGLWAQASDMTGVLSEGDLARLARTGLRALTSEQGLDLLDAARGVDRALVVPVRLDLGALRAQARAGVLPTMLRGLVRAPSRYVLEDAGRSLARRLAETPKDEREGVVLEVLRGEMAAVLGHTSADAVRPQHAFKDLGFDSLTAVELRNRLSVLTGLRLPATLVFDYPSPAALATYLSSALAPDATSAALPVDAEFDRLERMLATVDADAEEQARIAARLQALLSGWHDAQRPQGAAAAEQIQSASDAELFAFLDGRVYASDGFDTEDHDRSNGGA